MTTVVAKSSFFLFQSKREAKGVSRLCESFAKCCFRSVFRFQCFVFLLTRSVKKMHSKLCLFKGHLFSVQVADLGCSECTLLKKLKFHHDVELLVGVDIDGAKLKKKGYVKFLHGSQL